jgi:DNA-binding LacI/PurR family transcriptional regulator
LRAQLGREPIPEALLALSDIAAGHVLTACQELGIPVDRRPKMIAYDDFEFAPLLQTLLTVVRQPISEMVDVAMLTLFGKIDGTANPGTQTVSMPADLVIRRSCGCN